MSIPKTKFSSSNYSDNDFKDIFPVVEFHRKHLTGTEDKVTGTVTLTNNFGTDYAVFTSMYFGYTGSSAGTFTQTQTSGAITGNIIIANITDTSFEWNLFLASNQSINIYIIFMVVFNDSLDYPKSYS